MTRLATLLAALAVGGAGFYAACSKSTPEPSKSEEPAAVTAAPQMAPHPLPSAAAAADEAELTWDAPKAWESVANPNSMRKATYKIPRAPGDSEDGELAVSAAAGGVDANIKRWAGQFGNAEAKTEQRSPNGLKVTVVELKGTFASGGMMGGPSTPKENFMLLGAVVDGGDRQHFFKLTGPQKTVTLAKKDFDAFVATFRQKK